MGQISPLALLLIAVLGVPASATTTVRTASGDEHVGHVRQEEIAFSTDGGDRILLLRHSLDRIERVDGTTVHRVRLKDGTELEGTIGEDLVVNTGQLKRLLAPEDVLEVAFDIYVPLTASASVEDCPIRAALDVGLIVHGPAKSWHSSLPNRARCGDTYLNDLSFARKDGVNEEYVSKGAEPRKGARLMIEPRVRIAEGKDQHAHVSFTLVQGETVLGHVQRVFNANQGSYATGARLGLWYPSREVDPDGPPVTLRYQFLTTERTASRDAGSWWWWFTVRLD